MDKSYKEEKRKNKSAHAKIFPIPFSLGEKIENMTITFEFSKEQIINKAIQFHVSGKISQAKNYYQKIINLGYNDYRVFSNYAVILKSLGKLKAAEILTRRAIELNPDFVDAHLNLGTILRELGKLQEAEIYTRKAIKIRPDVAEFYLNLGGILRDLGNLQEAEISTRKAIKIKPDLANAHLNLGIILRNLGKLKEAELSYRKAIEINSDYAEAHSNLGSILRNIGQLQDAENSYRKAIELKPNLAEAYYGLSKIELLNGDYQSGLENYEFRFKLEKAVVPIGTTKLKQINKKKLHKGDKLLVVCEGGFGDTLQYMRYVPYLRTLGLDVSFCAQPKLHSLIKASYIDQYPLTPEEASKVSDGQWIPLLSLTRYLQVNPKNPIITEPYIYSTDALIRKWKNIFSQEKRPIIGINWQGNPASEKIDLNGRSLALETFSTLTKHAQVRMLSLQKGFGSEQLDECSFKNRFIECQSQIDVTWDFLETAAIIENCDLIITSDTSIAHLAGGMGKPTWLLLHHLPEWRWGMEGENTFWYKSMKLFRQKEPHNWDEVMKRVLIALHSFENIKHYFI